MGVQMGKEEHPTIRELGLQEIAWNRIIAENVKEKYVPLNQQAL